jgi:FlaG/FlaF family flagellin (archaellin)
MKKTLSFLVIFAFLFSSVFTTGCFDSKNGIFSTRALGFFGLALVVAASGGSGAAVAFAANVRGVPISTSTLNLAGIDVKVKIYDYTGNSKGTEPPLVEAVPEFVPASGTFVLNTTAEDEAKLTGKKQLLIEVEATKDGVTEVIMSAVYHTNKFVDLRDVTVDFASTALRVGYEKWLELGTNSDKDFAQFEGNVVSGDILNLADDIDQNTNAWLNASGSQILATPTAALVDAMATSAGTATFCRVYCDAIPGTEKDGDFEFVDVRKYFEIRATDVNATDESSNTYESFEIYSDATFDFYLEAGKTYTFSVAPKAGEQLEDIFGEEVEKTKESAAIEIAAGTTEKKLVAADFTDKVIE